MTNQTPTGSKCNSFHDHEMLHGKLRKDNGFCSPAILDSSDLHVELNCYAVELQSQTKLEDPTSISGSNITRNCNNNVYPMPQDSLTNMSPSDSISCESFYSCQSTISIQDVKNQMQNENDKEDIQFNKYKNNSLKEDFLDQLTMVNALVLSNSVNECLRNKDYKHKSKATCNKTSKNAAFTKNRAPNKYYSGAFTCKINHNNEQKLPNIKEKNLVFDRCKYDDQQNLSKHNDNIKEIKELNLLRRDFGGREKEEMVQNDTGDQRFVFQRRKPTILKLIKSVSNEPKITITKVGSLYQKNNKLDVVEAKYSIEHIKHSVGVGFDIMFIRQTNLKSYIKYVFPQKQELVLNKSVLCGDGNIIYKRIPNSFQQINKYFLGDIGDSQIKTLISHSLQKLQTESKQVSQFCVSLSCKRKDTNFLTYTTDTQDYFDNVTDLNSALKLTSSEKYQSSERVENEPSRITEVTNVSGLNYCNLDYRLPSVLETCVKRKSSDRKPILPVIEEESTEYLESEDCEDSITDSITDDYCLTDSLGNPISLFDREGLPLTDSGGRPLRLANGNLMMRCDNHGLPVIDEEVCDIYDMFGRTPRDNSFDPSVKPRGVHNKLSTNDGKPLLLFDTDGRPLTSVSGTMLVDCRGRSLVRVNTDSG